MDIVALRAYRGELNGHRRVTDFVYSILRLIIAIGQVGLDKSSRSRERNETFLLYLFGIGVAGGGIGGFFVTSSSQTRSPNPSAGRPGIPFSLRSALPIWQSVFSELSPWAAVTVFGVGARFGHVSDIIETGNLAP
jgi:hypothetical protein